MPVVVYDLERGPVAADAVDAVTDPQFAHVLADAMHVTNVDCMPPAALMADTADLRVQVAEMGVRDSIERLRQPGPAF